MLGESGYQPQILCWMQVIVAIIQIENHVGVTKWLSKENKRNHYVVYKRETHLSYIFYLEFDLVVLHTKILRERLLIKM